MDHTDLDQIERDQKIIADLGGPSKVAELLNFPKAGGQQRVQNWLARGIPPAIKVKRPDLFMKELPFAQQPRVQAATNFVAEKRGEKVADIPSAIQVVTEVAQAAIKHMADTAEAEIKHVAEAQAAVKTEVKDVDPPVKLPPLASTELADSLDLDERRIGLPTRRRKKQPFIGPDKRVGPPERRGFKLPEVTAVLPKGV